jgi:hypothetical protein
MKKIVPLLFLIGFVTTFSACKKNNDPEVDTQKSGVVTTPSGKSCLLNKITDVSDNESSTFEYDNQKRVTKILRFDGTQADGYATITYSTTQIVYNDFDQGSTTPDETITYTVANGRVTSGTYTETDIDENSGYTYTYTDTETYEYNSEGYLTKTTSNSTETSNEPNYQPDNDSYVTTYTYQNGNLITMVETGGDSSDTYTTSYEYNTDIVNTILVADYGIVIGKPNKNAIKKETQTNSNPNSSTYISNYTYELDADKNIKKATRTSGTDVDITTFNYTCN